MLPDLDDLRGRARAARTTPNWPPATSRCSVRRTYDFGLRAPLDQAGLIAGMSMTEKQGGSDVRANTTTATPQPDGSYRIVGHKWFTSAPMSDMFLTLAQAPGGLSLLPAAAGAARRHPQPHAPAAAQGQARQQVQRLARRSSTRTPPAGWSARRARACTTIIEMVNMTRLDCVHRLRRRHARSAPSRAVHHARHRAGLRRPADRSARDAQCARRPGRRIRGRDHGR